VSDVLFTVPVQGPDSDERFTPRWIFDALGETFDLDPASPVELETFVPAARRYTREDDGLSQEWGGFVWCNPPFSNATPWSDKFLANGAGLWLGPIANAAWFDRMLRACDVAWLMRDFAFVHPTHAGKRSSMPLAMFGFGDRAASAIDRAAALHPAAGVVVVRKEQPAPVAVTIGVTGTGGAVRRVAGRRPFAPECDRCGALGEPAATRAAAIARIQGHLSGHDS
jgi:hypothetical protein